MRSQSERHQLILVSFAAFFIDCIAKSCAWKTEQTVDGYFASGICLNNISGCLTDQLRISIRSEIRAGDTKDNRSIFVSVSQFIKIINTLTRDLRLLQSLMEPFFH